MEEPVEDFSVPPNVTLHVVPLGSPVWVNVTVYELGGEVTVRVYVVVFVKPPPDAFTIIVYVPVGVVGDVEMVIVLVNVGSPEDWLKLAEVPDGNPDADKPTNSGEPLVSDTVIG